MHVRFARTWNAAPRARVTVELLENQRTFHLCIVAVAEQVRATRMMPIASSHWATMVVPTVGEVAIVVDRWILADDSLAFDLAVRIAAPGAEPLVGPREHVRVPLPPGSDFVVGKVEVSSPTSWR
jgi:hypothetical protein